MSTQRLRIVHTTGYRYDGPVLASYNEARMTPASSVRQAVLDTDLRVEPVTWSLGYRDYWGTAVTAFEVLTPHEELSVVSSATVELFDAVAVDDTDTGHGATGPSWADLGAAEFGDTWHELLVQTPLTDPPDDVVARARQLAAGAPPAEAAFAVAGDLASALTYEPGVTSVRTPATEVWTARRGVCQDFAHLTIGALRAVGIPARYVSGYLHPRPDAPVGEKVVAESHAWLEWWLGRWVAYDPTHDGRVGQDHVEVARGRDYADVAPLKGIYSGAVGSRLFVTVEVTRLQ